MEQGRESVQLNGTHSYTIQLSVVPACPMNKVILISKLYHVVMYVSHKFEVNLTVTVWFYTVHLIFPIHVYTASIISHLSDIISHFKYTSLPDCIAL